MSSPTVSALLSRAVGQLNKSSDTPLLDAELLLCAACATDRTGLAARLSMEPTIEQKDTFSTMVKRRTAGEPIAYLLGRQEFWSLEFVVNPKVLVPRPETEHLVEQVLEQLPERVPCEIAELGTGSGAVALAIASERPSVRVTATDISKSALKLASENAGRLGINNVIFKHGDWLAPLDGHRYVLITSNPPYVRLGDPMLEADTHYEPARALTSGHDGLDALRVICGQSADHLETGGMLVLEHGHDQGPAVRELLSQGGFESIVTYADLAGRPRITWGQL